MRERIVVFLGSMAIVTGGYVFGWWVGSKPKPILPYSTTSCYLVETGYTKVVADEWKAGVTSCLSFSLEGKEIGTFCGNVDIRDIPVYQCLKMVKELTEPNLPEEKKG
jgi:hypothetical protein